MNFQELFEAFGNYTNLLYNIVTYSLDDDDFRVISISFTRSCYVNTKKHFIASTITIPFPIVLRCSTLTRRNPWQTGGHYTCARSAATKTGKKHAFGMKENASLHARARVRNCALTRTMKNPRDATEQAATEESTRLQCRVHPGLKDCGDMCNAEAAQACALCSVWRTFRRWLWLWWFAPCAAH